MIRVRLPLVIGLAALGALVAGCASNSKKADKPAELTDFQSTAHITRVWSANAGSGDPRMRLGLSLAADGEVLYAANHSGQVEAFRQSDGKRLWQTSTKVPLTGGPGAGAGLVVAGGSHGHIVALDAATGAIKWKSFINSELLSAPAISSDYVVFRTVDGRVAALKASDGTPVWSAEQQVPRLSLRGTARPSIVGDLVLSGFDNGRVLAFTLAAGDTVWDANVARSTGKTELDRLNDIDTQLVVRGTDVFVVTFQGKAARIDLETGTVQWSRDESSYSGLALDDDGVYITSATGAVIKLSARNSVELWNNPVLKNRHLSPPAVLGNLVAVADLDGYVHFFDKDTGTLAARVKVLSDRVTAEPVVSGDMLFMLDDKGNIVALRAGAAPEGKGTTGNARGSIWDTDPSRQRPR
jgi:outer membrane protein assembly factor BamB